MLYSKRDAEGQTKLFHKHVGNQIKITEMSFSWKSSVTKGLQELKTLYFYFLLEQ